MNSVQCISNDNVPLTLTKKYECIVGGGGGGGGRGGRGQRKMQFTSISQCICKAHLMKFDKVEIILAYVHSCNELLYCFLLPRCFVSRLVG